MSNTESVKVTQLEYADEGSIFRASEKQDEPLYALVRFGAPFKEAVQAVATKSDEDGIDALMSLFVTEQQTGTTTIRTVDGEKEIPWVLAIRSYYRGRGNWEAKADAETFNRVLTERSEWRKARDFTANPIREAMKRLSDSEK